MIVEEDPALQNYYDYLKQRGKNHGRLSNGTRKLTRRAVVHFLHFCNLEITNHTLSDLIETKQANPNNFEIEKALRKYCYSTPKTPITRTNEASYICSIFNRGNFTPLKIHINTHYAPEKTEIPEAIIKAIYREVTPELQIIQELEAYLGERRRAIGYLKLTDFNLEINPDYAVAFFDGEYTKGHIRHFSICPQQTALKAIKLAHKTGREFIFPNYETLWKKIKNYALKKYHVHYTSHYLRIRFETIADDTGISMNKVSYLMGGTPHTPDTTKLAHLPEHYLLKEAKKYIRFYDQFLAKPLSLGNSD